MYVRIITYMIKLHSPFNVSQIHWISTGVKEKLESCCRFLKRKGFKKFNERSRWRFRWDLQHLLLAHIRAHPSKWTTGYTICPRLLSPSSREIYWTTLCRGIGWRSMLHNALMKHDSLTQQDETFRSIVTDTECSSSSSSILSAALPPASTFLAAMLMRRLLIN